MAPGSIGRRRLAVAGGGARVVEVVCRAFRGDRSVVVVVLEDANIDHISQCPPPTPTLPRRAMSVRASEPANCPAAACIARSSWTWCSRLSGGRISIRLGRRSCRICHGFLHTRWFSEKLRIDVIDSNANIDLLRKLHYNKWIMNYGNWIWLDTYAS